MCTRLMYHFDTQFELVYALLLYWNFAASASDHISGQSMVQAHGWMRISETSNMALETITRGSGQRAVDQFLRIDADISTSSQLLFVNDPSNELPSRSYVFVTNTIFSVFQGHSRVHFNVLRSQGQTLQCPARALSARALAVSGKFTERSSSLQSLLLVFLHD